MAIAVRRQFFADQSEFKKVPLNPFDVTFLMQKIFTSKLGP